jgi:hypothetical protein
MLRLAKKNTKHTYIFIGGMGTQRSSDHQDPGLVSYVEKLKILASLVPSVLDHVSDILGAPWILYYITKISIFAFLSAL